MKLSDKYSVLKNLFLWTGIYLFWIFIFQNRSLTITRTLTIEFCYLIFIALCFYLQILILIPRLLNKEKLGLYIFYTFLSLTVAAGLRTELALFITHSYFFSPESADLSNIYFRSLLNIFIWTTLLTMGYFLIERMRAQRKMEEIEKEKIENELNFLKAQNNPHFLFNSLNAIYFQIDRNNKGARETLMKFSEMLRYQLYECNALNIDIEKEVKYLSNYVELQKLRMNDNYEILLNNAENIIGFQIAPLLLIPLVENAFKFVSHQTEGTNKIIIDLSYQSNEFRYSIINTKEKIRESVQNGEGGIGLKNVRRRLELLYPNTHSLTIEDGENIFTVTLNLVVNNR